MSTLILLLTLGLIALALALGVPELFALLLFVPFVLFIGGAEMRRYLSS